MNRRSFLAISSAALVAAPTFGQDRSALRHDGNWWKSLNNLTKYGYVAGYAEGSEKADATWAYGECKTKVTTKYSDAVQKGNDYSGMTFGQLIEGVDEFYKDFRNTRILTRDAMMVIKQQISGISQKEIDETLQVLRQTALDPRY
jgi:hypothetical protein